MPGLWIGRGIRTLTSLCANWLDFRQCHRRSGRGRGRRHPSCCSSPSTPGSPTGESEGRLPRSVSFSLGCESLKSLAPRLKSPLTHARMCQSRLRLGLYFCLGTGHEHEHALRTHTPTARRTKAGPECRPSPDERGARGALGSPSRRDAEPSLRYIDMRLRWHISPACCNCSLLVNPRVHCVHLNAVITSNF